MRAGKVSAVGRVGDASASLMKAIVHFIRYNWSCSIAAAPLPVQRRRLSSHIDCSDRPGHHAMPLSSPEKPPKLLLPPNCCCMGDEPGCCGICPGCCCCCCRCAPGWPGISWTPEATCTIRGEGYTQDKPTSRLQYEANIA